MRRMPGTRGAYRHDPSRRGTPPPNADFESAFRRGSQRGPAPAPMRQSAPARSRPLPSRTPMRRGGLARRYRPASISRRGGYARQYASNQVARGFRGVELPKPKTAVLLAVAAIGLYFVFTSGLS